MGRDEEVASIVASEPNTLLLPACLPACMYVCMYRSCWRGLCRLLTITIYYYCGWKLIFPRSYIQEGRLGWVYDEVE